MARPTPTRTFTIELSPAGSPRTGVDHDYTGKQSTPATRLPLARHTTVWAAKKETKATKEKTGDASFVSFVAFCSITFGDRKITDRKILADAPLIHLPVSDLPVFLSFVVGCG
jgi:hypothetical protein